MRTKRGTLIQIVLIGRTVNVRLVESPEAAIQRVSLQDLEEVLEIVKKDCPWLTRENSYFMMPVEEYGSHFGIIFDIPEDQPIPEHYNN